MFQLKNKIINYAGWHVGVGWVESIFKPLAQPKPLHVHLSLSKRIC